MRWLVCALLLVGCKSNEWTFDARTDALCVDLTPSSPSVVVTVNGGLVEPDGRRGRYGTSALGLLLGVQHYLDECVNDECLLGVDMVTSVEARPLTRVRLGPGQARSVLETWGPALDDCDRRTACSVPEVVELHLVGDELIEVEIAGFVEVSGRGNTGFNASELFVQITTDVPR